MFASETIAEPADETKSCEPLNAAATACGSVDAIRVASKTIGGLYNGATTKELDSAFNSNRGFAHCRRTRIFQASGATAPDGLIAKEVANQAHTSLNPSRPESNMASSLSKIWPPSSRANARKLNRRGRRNRSELFEYFGLRTIYDRYLLRNPETRKVLETPQYFFLRVACGLSRTVHEAIEFYCAIAAHDYMPSSPTLFNSGTRHAQMSSCYLLDSPAD